MANNTQRNILTSYALGEISNRQAIERLGLHDYANLIIALAQHDLPFPQPRETATTRAHREKARAILQPRLQGGR